MGEVGITDELRRWAKPDAQFREDLLQRCLAVLGQDNGEELDDSELEMLAAAGDAYSTIPFKGDTSVI